MFLFLLIKYSKRLDQTEKVNMVIQLSYNDHLVTMVFFFGGALSSDPEQAFLGILNENLLKKKWSIKVIYKKML
jgi:hypothetical protein